MDLTPGPEVYLAAALAQQVAWRPDEDPDWQRRIAERMATEPGFRVVVDLAYRAGREAAAQAIERHADKFAPSGGNLQQSQMRRHLLIAARVAAPTPTVEQIADAVRRGDYAACYLDEAGQPVAEKG